MSYSVQVGRQAEKQLAALPRNALERCAEAIRELETNPRPPGSKKLVGGDGEHRVRVGDYRIVYVVDDAAKTVDVTVIRHRREVYR